MGTVEYYSVTGIVLFLIGLYALITVPALIRKILAVNVSASGVFLFLIATAYSGLDTPPDPIPHALVLTGIVVSISTTALGLWLATLIEHAAADGGQGDA